MAELFKYLAARYPGTLTQIIIRTLDEPGQHQPYASLPYECWDVIRELPGPSRLELWHHFQGRPGIRRLLRAQLLGSDTQWIAQLLDAEEITPDEVLASYDGTEPAPPVEELAKILVPRGIDPARIAALMLWGQYSGSLSSWYQSSVDTFTAMLQTDNPSVKAAATEGIEIFTRQRDQAAHRERLERIRGHV